MAIVTVTFDHPTFDGGSPIVEYTVTGFQTDPNTEEVIEVGTVTTDGESSMVDFPELDPGYNYHFTVHATNAVGDSNESDPSNSVLVATVPDAPTNVVASFGGNI